MRAFFTITTILALFCGGASFAADPAKDPNGWENLRFGMTLQEVVTTLGKKARSKSRQNEVPRRPRMRKASEAKQYAEEVLADAKSEPEKYDEQSLKAAREIVRLSKPRTWITRVQRVVGTYEEEGPQGHVVIRNRKGEFFSTAGGDVDANSQKAIEAIQKAMVLLDECRLARDLDGYESKDDISIETSEDLVVERVEQYGMKMDPSLGFGPNLSSITLTCIQNVDNSPSTLIDSYELLCKRLADEYGPPDSSTLRKGVRRREWNFPKTTVTVFHKRNSSFVPQYRKGEGIVFGESTVEQVFLSFLSPVLQKNANALPVGTRLVKGEQLVSQNGRYTLALKHDGDLVLTRLPNNVLWSTLTAGQEVGGLSIQEDSGELQLIRENGSAVWSAKGNEGITVGDQVILQDDGNLVFYNGMRAVWDTRTNGR